jgi:epoxyqueuosine reductase
MSDLIDNIRAVAGDEGFHLCGVAPAIAATGHTDLVRWIESGYAAGMDYFADRIDAYAHPGGVLAGTRSIVVLAYPYPAGPSPTIALEQGRVARYAWTGTDYHDVLHPKLKRIARVITDSVSGSSARGVVDTAPIMEREIAQLAGLGWRGKNTLLLHRKVGSYFFLACVLTDVDLPTDADHSTTFCGSCTACLDACPTDAFVGPGILDAGRCISYLTIEHRGAIDPELRPGIGEWVFGCDVCQEVCPWNRKPTRAAAAQDDEPASLDRLDLPALFDMTEDEFRAEFRKTPMWRTRRRGLLRNAAIVLGNRGDATFVNVLVKGLSDAESIVRGASAWALGRIGTPAAKRAILDRRAIETDAEVIAELDSAIQ